MQYIFTQQEANKIKHFAKELESTLTSIQRAVGNSSDQNLKTHIKAMIKSSEISLNNIKEILK